MSEPFSSPKRRFSRLAIAAISLIAVAFPIHFIRSRVDHGEANVVFALLTSLGILLGWLSVVRSKNLSIRSKQAATLLPVVPILAGLWRYEFAGFDGELKPKFRMRSAKVETPSTADVAIPSVSASGVASKSTVPTGEFNQFLGNNRNGIVDGIRLYEDWSQKPPQILWKKPIGAGWSGFAIKNGLAVTLEEHNDEDCVIALGCDDGMLRWRTKLGGKHYHAMGGGGPMATPTIVDDRLWVQSSVGVVACLSLTDGKLLWSVDLLKLAGIDGKDAQSIAEQAVTWGRSGSPLVDGDLVVVPFGGKPLASAGSLIAFDRTNGEERWRAGREQISYASPSKLRIRGEDQIVIVNEANVTGHVPATGEVLWEFAWPGQSNGGASVSQPLSIDDNRVFLSKSYYVGSTLLDFSKSVPGKSSVTSIWKDASLMKSKFTNVVFLDGYIYGLSDGIIECIRADDGKRMWKDSKKGRFGHGQILLVGNHILIAAEEGQCVLMKARPEKPEILGEFPAIEGVTWNPLAIVGDRLFMRNGQEAACVQLPVE
jgi:outer membrane protein assembly factor BamB